MTSLQEKLAYLDAALTRKDWRTVKQTADRQAVSAENLIGREYYLSDGGYSRVVWSLDKRRLFLTSNSRPKVSEMWANCKELIADAEMEIVAELTEGGWYEK